MPEQELTAPQRALVETWERHMAAEFDSKSVDATMATMTEGFSPCRARHSLGA